MDADKVTQSDKSLIQWDVENGTILKKDGLVPSATIKWNEGISQGKIIATYVKDMSIQNVRTLTPTVTMFVPKQPFEPDDPSYSGELLTLNISNKAPKQYEYVNINLAEHYNAVPRSIEWTIDGVRSVSEQMSKQVYFPTIGTKNISAKIYFYGISETKTISTTVTVGSGAPNLAGKQILGPTKLGVTSSAIYRMSAYSVNDVSYTWTVRFKNMVFKSVTSEFLSMDFPEEGSYTISCVAKDKRTGMTGTSATLRVSASYDAGILGVEDDLFTVNLETNRSLRIMPVGEMDSNISNKAQYKLCSLSTGEIAKTGYVDINLESNIDLSSLCKGMYVLYIQLDSNRVKTYKFLLAN